ncbi:hypothetical protein EDB81DRAFT_809444 [Dactylonectria macrodidyma]|uniref:DUF2306 domain-containing protein n=1 Tax=Dactylonectria macrodidyma TaxID=307937 RepID=A0A9P9IQI4_9HYPO|nr:hypothetical protein EDB81DRAFT_809444 [Dactylonectria macrodidyma]
MSSAISLQPANHGLIQLSATSVRATPTTKSSPDTNINNGTETEQAPKTSFVFTWPLLSIPAFFVAAYALNFLLDVVRLGDPAIIERIRASIFGVGHIVGGLTAIALGPFQFLAGIRRRVPKVHRWIGRVYMAGIILGGINTLHVSFTSICRPLGQYAFAFLGIIWMGTAAQGMYTIWAGEVLQHRDWMARNFALTYAAVMLRWQLPLFIAMGMETEPALTLTGFTSWIPNLLFVEWWIRRRVLIS